MPTIVEPKLYNPRHPERTLLYQTVAEHYETWLELACSGQFDGQGDHHTPKAYVRKAFEKYLKCSIFAHDFARARCDDCGHDYFVAFSCKGRGICPSCNTRRMVETAAHLNDHGFPLLPVRQWVFSVPRRLRYFMQRDGAVLNIVLRISLRVFAQSLQSHSPGAAQVDKTTLHIGALAFIHRFGSNLDQLVQSPNDPRSMQAGINLNAQRFPVDFVKNIKGAKLASLPQRTRHDWAACPLAGGPDTCGPPLLASPW